MNTKTHHNQTSNEKEQTKTRVERKSQQRDQTFLPRPADALQRVTHAPPSAMRPADVLALQSSVGNRAVQRLAERAQPRTGDPGIIQRRWVPSDIGTAAEAWARSRERDEVEFTEFEGMAWTRDGRFFRERVRWDEESQQIIASITPVPSAPPEHGEGEWTME